jgi:HEAT repeat protein
MNLETYTPPVAKLLTYDEPEPVLAEDWPNYLELGIGPEHIPELIHMVADKDLRTTDPNEKDPKYWAAVHAWRALGQLRAISAVEPLLQLSEELISTESGVDEWAIEELPDVYGLIGPAAIPSLAKFLAEPSHGEFPLDNAARGIEKIGTMHPEAREEAIKALARQLESFEENDYTVNATLVGSLGALKATETLPLIEQAFAANRVDEFIIDLDDVLIYFGLKTREQVTQERLQERLGANSSSPSHLEATPPPLTLTPRESYWRTPQTSSQSGTGKKAKNKMKMVKTSRKKNRRKK